MIALLVSLFFVCWNAGVAKFIVPQVHHRHRLHLHLPTSTSTSTSPSTSPSPSTSTLTSLPR